MSISQKQLESNRRNAQKSTGPKTEKGKTIAACNSIKHGLYSKSIAINTPKHKEDAAEFAELHADLKNELRPIGVFQEHLVKTIANAIWRLRRTVIAETSQINRQMDDIDSDIRYAKMAAELIDTDSEEDPEKEADDLINRIGTKIVPDENVCRKLLLYEMRLNRQITRAFKMLKMLQTQDKVLEKGPYV